MKRKASRTDGPDSGPACPVSVGSPEFTQELMSAITEATSQAAAEHLAAGHPVYITDDDGDICEVLLGRPPRKLSQAEIDSLLSQDPA
jgi:hypothetical protein